MNSINESKSFYQLTHITKNGQVVCFQVPFNVTYETLVRCCVRPEDSNCPHCLYYYTHPDAREMEMRFRNAQIIK